MSLKRIFCTSVILTKKPYTTNKCRSANKAARSWATVFSPKVPKSYLAYKLINLSKNLTLYLAKTQNSLKQNTK